MSNLPLQQHGINLARCVGLLLVVDHGVLKPHLKAHPKDINPVRIQLALIYRLHFEF